MYKKYLIVSIFYDALLYLLKMANRDKAIYYQVTSSQQLEYRLVELTTKREYFVQSLRKIVTDVKEKRRVPNEACDIETINLMLSVREATFAFFEACEAWQLAYTRVRRPRLLECDYLVKMVSSVDFVNGTYLRRKLCFRLDRGNILLIPRVASSKNAGILEVSEELSSVLKSFATPTQDKVINVYQIMLNCLPPEKYEKLVKIEDWFETPWIPKVTIRSLPPIAGAKTSNLNQSGIVASTKTKLESSNVNATPGNQNSNSNAGNRKNSSQGGVSSTKHETLNCTGALKSVANAKPSSKFPNKATPFRKSDANTINRDSSTKTKTPSTTGIHKLKKMSMEKDQPLPAPPAPLSPSTLRSPSPNQTIGRTDGLALGGNDEKWDLNDMEMDPMDGFIDTDPLELELELDIARPPTAGSNISSNPSRMNSPLQDQDLGAEDCAHTNPLKLINSTKSTHSVEGSPDSKRVPRKGIKDKSGGHHHKDSGLLDVAARGINTNSPMISPSSKNNKKRIQQSPPATAPTFSLNTSSMRNFFATHAQLLEREHDDEDEDGVY